VIRIAVALSAIILLLMLMSVGGMSWQQYDQAAQAAPACGGTAPKLGAPVVHGKYTAAQIAQLWVSEGGPRDQAQIAGAVGMAESGGDPNAYNPSGATGLMQILGAVLPGDLRDPAVNMRNAIKKWRDAHGWTPWVAYTNGNYLRYMGKAGVLPSGPVTPEPADCFETTGNPDGPITGTPKHIIDTIVLPLANENGITRTIAQNDMANSMHGPTQGGSTSDHQGPPEVAWAADMSNGITTPQEDRLAAALAKRFGIPWTGAGLVSVTHGGYRFQLIYRINTPQAGDHFTHVHFGCRRVA
jgi:hypothetical protein